MTLLTLLECSEAVFCFICVFLLSALGSRECHCWHIALYLCIEHILWDQMLDFC